MHPARELWTRYESIHAGVYFHPDALAAFEGAGLRGFWRGYFAQRAAPLGAVGEAPVRASFFGFSAAMTARALPAVWNLITPEAALELRLDAAQAALLEPWAAGDRTELTGVADELWELSVALPCDGRVLGAANAVLPRPGDPVRRLWQASTSLREHRGDGHVVAAVAAGLSGLELLVLRGAEDLDGQRLRAVRGWSDDEWDAASDSLRERGLLGTDDGRELLQVIEEMTDDLAWDAWLAAGGTEADAERISAALTEPARRCRTVLPEDNPIGVPTF
jgi:hypothetical protein